MTKFKTSIFGICILSLFVLTSCKEDVVSSSKISVDNILRYYYAICTNEATTYVTATFLTNAAFDKLDNPFGRRVALDQSSSVTFNGEPMKLKTGFFSGTVYTAKVEDKWPKKFEFVWTDNKGKKHKDVASMDTIWAKKDWLIRRGGQYTAVWDGSPVKAGEEVAVTIKAGEDEWYDKTNRVGARSIQLRGLTLFNPMKYHTVDFTRRMVKHISKEKASGNMAKGTYIKFVYSVEK